jgi:hypothetical protein
VVERAVEAGATTEHTRELGLSMKSRRRCKDGHCQLRVENFAKIRAFAHIAQHAIVDSQSPVGILILVQSLKIPGSSSIS